MVQKQILKNYKSSENERLRKSSQFKAWRECVFLRDNFTCQLCGNKKDLHPHHKKSFAEYPELRFVISNGQTLCSKCHGEIHGLKYNKLGRYLTCALCQIRFRPKYGHLGQECCSKKCGYKLRSQRPNAKKGRHYPHLIKYPLKICPVCNKEFRAVWHKARKQKYCSLNCWKTRRCNR